MHVCVCVNFSDGHRFQCISLLQLRHGLMQLRVSEYSANSLCPQLCLFTAIRYILCYIRPGLPICGHISKRRVPSVSPSVRLISKNVHQYSSIFPVASVTNNPIFGQKSQMSRSRGPTAEFYKSVALLLTRKLRSFCCDKY